MHSCQETCCVSTRIILLVLGMFAVFGIVAGGALADTLPVPVKLIKTNQYNGVIDAFPSGELTYVQTVTNFGFPRFYVTDGTPAGTHAILIAGDQKRPVGLGASTNGFFIATSANDGYYFTLWYVANGTTQPIRIFEAGEQKYAAAPGSKYADSVYPSAVLGDRLVIRIGWDLFISDGTAANTFPFKQFPQPPVEPEPLNVPVIYPVVPLGDQVVVNAYDENVGVELWVSDGTEAGTHVLADLTVRDPEGSFAELPPSSFSTLLTAVHEFPSHVVFQGNSGVVFPSPHFMNTGAHVWVLDKATRQVIQLPAEWNTARSFAFMEGSYYAVALLDAPRGVKFFRADDSWQQFDEYPSISINTDFVTPIKGLNGKLFLGVYTGIGLEPHVWDPSTNQLTLVKDIHPTESGLLTSRYSAHPENDIAVQGNYAYFFAYEPAHGSELWRSDGTTEGTAMVADLAWSNALQYPGENLPVWKSRGTLIFAQPDETVPAKGPGDDIRSWLWSMTFEVVEPTVSIQGGSPWVEEGGMVRLEAVVEQASGPATFQWLRYGVPVDEADSQTFEFLATPERSGSYTVRISFDGGTSSVESAPFLLHVYESGELPLGSGAVLAVLLAGSGALIGFRRSLRH